MRQVSRRGRRGRRYGGERECRADTPAARDNLTGWFIYQCTAGILLVPGPRCVGPECRGAALRPTRLIGVGDEILEGTDGSFSGARRAFGLTAATGTEIAQQVGTLEALRRDGQISDEYFRRARAAVEKEDTKFLRPIAPGVVSPLLGQVIAPRGLARLNVVNQGTPVGPSVREGCQCTPRVEDARDPVSGWLIYYIPGGVLLTPNRKCIAGSGSRLSWLTMTWRNTLALFRTPPPPEIVAAPPSAPPIPLPPPLPGAPPAAPGPAPACVPDIVLGRDDGPFGTGWYVVLREGRRMLVAGPRTC